MTVEQFVYGLIVVVVLICCSVGLMYRQKAQTDAKLNILEDEVRHAVQVMSENNRQLSERITSAGKTLADIQAWREELQKTIDGNKKVVAAREQFRVREVR